MKNNPQQSTTGDVKNIEITAISFTYQTIIHRSLLSHSTCNVKIKISYVIRHGNEYKVGDHERERVLRVQKMLRKTRPISR